MLLYSYYHWAAILVDIVLVILLISRWGQLASRLRKGLALVIMVGVSALVAVPVGHSDMETMKQVDFCMRCHEMHPFGKSLEVADRDALSAVHAQNNYVPQQTACYSCHTDYTMFGPLKAKLHGLIHLWVHYTNSVPKRIKLYKPYNSDNCLYCHGPSKRFREDANHHTADAPLQELLSGRKSCLECHDVGHKLEKEAGK